MDKQQHKLRNGVKGFTGFVISGMDESAYMLTGDRAKGGCPILWRETLSAIVQPVNPVSMSCRLCSVVITINDTVLLLMCVYFPTDPQTVPLNETTLSLVLDDIQAVIDSV